MSEPHTVCRNPEFSVASFCVWPVGAGMQAPSTCLVTVPRRNLLRPSCLFCLLEASALNHPVSVTVSPARGVAEGAGSNPRLQPGQVGNYQPSTLAFTELSVSLRTGKALGIELVTFLLACLLN